MGRGEARRGQLAAAPLPPGYASAKLSNMLCNVEGFAYIDNTKSIHTVLTALTLLSLLLLLSLLCIIAYSTDSKGLLINDKRRRNTRTSKAKIISPQVV